MDLPTSTSPPEGVPPAAPGLSFGREMRLRTSSEFRLVREKGKSRAGRYIVMNVAPAPAPKNAATAPKEPAATRFGFITSRKVGNAVARNQVRRRLREIARLHLPQVRSGFWVVTVARYTASQANYHSLQEEWLRLARQLGILPAHSPKN